MPWVAGASHIFLIYFGYITIFLASLFGNSFIIHIIRTEDSMKTTINYLILNQACADLLVSLLQLMNAIHNSSFNQLWFGGIGGLITCKLIQASFLTLPFFSIWILTVIAFERYYAVIRPLQLLSISQNLKKTIVLLWVWSFVSSTGIIVSANVEKFRESHYCLVSNVSPFWRKYNMIVLVLNSLLPLLLITVLYTVICVKMWSREVPGDETNRNHGPADAIRTEWKVTRMIIAVVVLFLVCWLPIQISSILQSFGHIQIRYSLGLFLLWLTVVYSGLNPYVYFIFSAKFRKKLKSFFGNFIIVLHCRSQSVELQQV